MTGCSGLKGREVPQRVLATHSAVALTVIISAVLLGCGGTGAAAVTAAAGLPWHLTRIQADQAWQVTKGNAAVVVAVVGSGFDVEHPGLKPHLWTNTLEVPANGLDDDRNGYVDDVHGANVYRCTASAPANRSRVCDGAVGIGTNLDSYDTSMAGIIAATFDAKAGVAGVAPKARLMLIKAVGPGASYLTLLAAYDYALRNGAHIMLSSQYVLQPAAPLPAYIVEAFSAAVRALEAKKVLLVSPAGSELTDLDAVASRGGAFPPCGLNASNVVCVAASDTADRLIRAKTGNFELGSNWGARTVDIAAPGLEIPSTVPGVGGPSGNTSGTGAAAAVVAGVAALVTSVLGKAGKPASYYKATQVRSLLLGTCDQLPGGYLVGKVSCGGRVNALQAVNAAKGGYKLLRPSVSHASHGGSTSLKMYGMAEEYYAAVVVQAPGGAKPAQGRVGWDTISLPPRPFDTSVRFLTDIGFVTSLTSFKYSAGTSPTGVLVLRLSGLLSLPTPGAWGVQLSGQAPAANVRLTLGTQVVNLSAPAVPLMAQSAGMYDFEMLILNPEQPLELRLTVPKNASDAASIPTFFLASYAPAVHPRYAPNVSLDSTPLASPPGWHLAWTYVARSPARANLPPSVLANASLGASPPPPPSPASAPDSAAAAATPPPLRNTALRAGLFPEPGSFGALARDVALQAQASPGASPNITVPDPATMGAYGVAVAHMRSAYPAPAVIMRVTCSSCQLYVQGVMVIDASQTLPLGTAPAAGGASAPSHPPPRTVSSSCLYLGSAGASSGNGGEAVYTLELRFAVGDLSAASAGAGGASTGSGSTGGVLDVQYSKCAYGGIPSFTYEGIGPLLTSAVMWAPAPNATRRRGAMQCDVWVAGSGDPAVPSPRDRAPLASATLPLASTFATCLAVGARSPNCTLVAVKDIYPAAAATYGGSYHLRCWAFWSGTFKGGLVAMGGAGTLSPTVQRAATYLADQMVFRIAPPPGASSGGGGSGGNSPAPTAPALAPLAASFPPYLPLLAFEYANVSASFNAGLLDGSAAFALGAQMVIDERMVLPVPP